MKKSYLLIVTLLPIALFTSACRSVLPSEAKSSRSQWKTFEEARSSFERIEPNKTTLADLKTFGYDPDSTHNMRILTYADVIQRFLPNSSMRVEDLHEAVQECIREKDACRAYEMEVSVVNGDRYGNVCADILGFRKRTRVTGWTFRGLIVTKNDVVIYKLWSGEPNINRVEQKRKPLGPFQELDGVLYKAATAGY
jgi:hypothetical protein